MNRFKFVSIVFLFCSSIFNLAVSDILHVGPDDDITIQGNDEIEYEFIYIDEGGILTIRENAEVTVTDDLILGYEESVSPGDTAALFLRENARLIVEDEIKNTVYPSYDGGGIQMLGNSRINASVIRLVKNLYIEENRHIFVDVSDEAGWLRVGTTDLRGASLEIRGGQNRFTGNFDISYANLTITGGVNDISSVDGRASIRNDSECTITGGTNNFHRYVIFQYSSNLTITDGTNEFKDDVDVSRESDLLISGGTNLFGTNHTLNYDKLRIQNVGSSAIIRGGENTIWRFELINSEATIEDVWIDIGLNIRVWGVSGSELNLNAGTTLNYEIPEQQQVFQNVGLNVDPGSSLNIYGTEESPVTLTCEQVREEGDTWGGIDFFGCGDGFYETAEGDLNYMIIEHAGGIDYLGYEYSAIRVINGIVQLNNCIIRNGKGGGLQSDYGGAEGYLNCVQMNSCEVYNFDYEGVQLADLNHDDGQDPLESFIINCKIHDCGLAYEIPEHPEPPEPRYGAGCLVMNGDANHLIIRNSYFYNNMSYGLMVGTYDYNVYAYDGTSPNIFNNAFFANGCQDNDCEDGGGLFIGIQDYNDPVNIYHNTSWRNGIPEGDDDHGFILKFFGEANFEEEYVDFKNNIAGKNGGTELYFIDYPEPEDDPCIGWTGVRCHDEDDVCNIDYSTDDDFYIDIVIGGGVDDDVRIVNEAPDEEEWDFHLVWRDARYVNNCQETGEYLIDEDGDEELDPDPDGSDPDIGAFGGPYADDWSGEDFYVLILWDEPVATQIDPYWAWYRVGHNISIGPGGGLDIEPGTEFLFNEGAQLTVSGYIDARGTSTKPIVFGSFDESNWDGLVFNSNTNIASTFLEYSEFSGADYGVHLTGVTGTGRLPIDNCTIVDCETGIYANGSRVEITDTEISDCLGNGSSSYGNAIYLTNSTAGQVIIDGCDITENGYDATYSSGAIYVLNSDAKIINTEVFENSGTGITCIGSSPDLDAYDTAERHNDIHDNGPGSPLNESDGAEIYLDYQSTPDIRYNNIYHCVEDPFSAKGYAVFMDEAHTSTINAKNNWWGTNSPSSYESDLFHEGTGTLTYDPWASSEYGVSSMDEYARGMRLWDRGEYEAAARIFRRTINDTGSVGINSVHYLTGCVGEMEDGDFEDQRDFLIEVAERHRDERVSRVAERWATHCLTEIREYEDAMEEYVDRAQNADCLRDSVMAVIDYLAVLELYDGDNVDAAGESIIQQTHLLMNLLDEEREADALLPETFSITTVYPNPFNSATNIAFNLQEDGYIKLTIHDLQGREVTLLYEGQKTAGVHALVWDASGMASGVYICRLQSKTKITSIKMAMVR